MNILTIEKLKIISPGIFEYGEGNYPELLNEKIRWVAVRGGIHDWAIYYHKAAKDWEYIKNQGDKIYQESIIKKLVPCDNKAWKMYRF